MKPGPAAIKLPAERALVLTLDGFNEALRAAYDKRMSHHGSEVTGLTSAPSARCEVFR